VAERVRIVGHLKPTGKLVLAGVLRSQFTELRRAYQQEGLRLVVHREEKEWTSGAFAMDR